MSHWDAIYRDLEVRGLDKESQLAGTAWLDPFLPLVGNPTGQALDLGCGAGADLLRLAREGWQPVGLDHEPRAVELAQRLHGFPVKAASFEDPLPFEDDTFSLVISRFALHLLPPNDAVNLFREVRRVLAPGGHFVFAVNSDVHRQQGLQYDYTGAVEKEPGYWFLPSLGFGYLFYTPERARDLLGSGWEIRHLNDGFLMQWDISKQAVTCVAEKV